MLLIEFQGNENFCRMGKILMKERRKKMKQSIDISVQAEKIEIAYPTFLDAWDL